jgi:isopentenyldiphosphate isomerase
MQSEGSESMAEIIDLYDVDRQLTGKTANRGDALEEGTYRMVVHVCIFNSNGEMLIQRRADDIVRWPSYWDVSVGGGASAGDTSRQAAQRETAEELGLHIDFSNRRPVITVNFYDGFDDFYTVEQDILIEDLNLQSEEVAEIKWASQEEVEAMIDNGSFIPYQRDLIGYLFFAREGRGTWNL